MFFINRNITIWSNVESGVGIIAASIPPMRRLFACLRSTIGSTGRSREDAVRISGYGPRYASGSQAFANDRQSKRGGTGVESVPLETLKTSATVSTTSAGGPYRAKVDGKGWERMEDDEVNSFSSTRNIVP